MSAPLACDLTVLTTEQRGRLRILVRRVFDACAGAAELPNGFRLLFSGRANQSEPAAGSLAVAIAEWITFERRCCPCITFAIEFEEEQGPIAVRMTGGPGIKPFLLAEFKWRIADKLPDARG
jgi:hypothetical protein